MSFGKMFRKIVKSSGKENQTVDSQTSKVVALLPVYNSGSTLSLTLDSLIPYVDRIVIFEGAYDDSPDSNVRSTDRTLNIAYAYQRDFPGKVELYLQRARMTRIEKWNYLVSLVMPGDLALTMDFDGALLVFGENPFEEAKQGSADYYLLDVVEYRPERQGVSVEPSMKLIRKKPGLKFTGKNWVVTGAREEILGGPAVTVDLLKQMNWYVPKAQIFHLEFFRSIMYRSQTYRTAGQQD